MKEAQVETLTEPEPSPPVPTRRPWSGALDGQHLGAHRRYRAGVISSTVSPRTRNASETSPPVRPCAREALRSTHDVGTRRWRLS